MAHDSSSQDPPAGHLVWKQPRENASGTCHHRSHGVSGAPNTYSPLAFFPPVFALTSFSQSSSHRLKVTASPCLIVYHCNISSSGLCHHPSPHAALTSWVPSATWVVLATDLCSLPMLCIPGQVTPGLSFQPRYPASYGASLQESLGDDSHWTRPNTDVFSGLLFLPETFQNIYLIVQFIPQARNKPKNDTVNTKFYLVPFAC